ncbi:bifunctional diaminohydroxyphosphoribosylaminopyrimidine deaminase/5-amino-6-(5-phosphoribosylamino)uracil reductase RibD [Pareuzebyella sediminis]|uniref:bifunctional diaminohydroxyphosphoribosylaminopyrimidine deaminase/5-amino-6-(5-phosphoribosylamino)uracil reductase RibD n=1 Tax=Pareuzebyella sediminis TaxID=2607998 RepID=UPI001E444960|nr:bifunctional diaminohydroxyphosphoribosylaminopyrimidine deaminase/5-amino-6-(5-phosphoribosylamino)uracil reductase RibD [Pareuzebyella sediminis]
MLRCIEIAKNGLGTTAPNPMVGALLVYNGKIIGEGFTSAYGGPHAEVNAIASVEDKSLLSKATLYVTLEPCCHFGKTPPCTDLIIKSKIPHVIIGLTDPHEKVSGQGIRKLRSAGIDVITGVLEKECREHHRRFLCFHTKKRPYVILKWAQTADGFIAPERHRRDATPRPFWITQSNSRQLVHKWRTEEQAILVGTHTVLEDNPKLNARYWIGKNPIRIIIDKELKVPRSHHVFDGTITTIVLTGIKKTDRYAEKIIFELLDYSKALVPQIFEICYRHNIISLIVEGGAQTLQTFIAAHAWDEARVFTGNAFFKKGIEAPVHSGTLTCTSMVGSDELKIYRSDD